MKRYVLSTLTAILVVTLPCLILAQEPAGDPGLEQERISPEFEDEIPDWQARWELARLLSYVERYQESINQYEKLLQEKPDLDEARLELARVYYWAGETDQARELFAALPQEELSQEARLELAEIYALQEDYPRAVELYQEHLRDNPEDHRARFKLAQVLSWQGEYDSSIQEYQQVLEAKPGDNQVRRHYAQVLMWAEKYEQAISELEKTLED